MSRCGTSSTPEQARILRLLIERIDVTPNGISVTLDAAGIQQPGGGAGGPGTCCSGFRILAGCRGAMTGRAALELDTLTIRIPIRLQRPVAES